MKTEMGKKKCNVTVLYLSPFTTSECNQEEKGSTNVGSLGAFVCNMKGGKNNMRIPLCHDVFFKYRYCIKLPSVHTF